MNRTYFLGANSSGGFFSCYDSFCRSDGDFLYLIKSGPGSGKSTLMRRVARAAAERGMDVETVLCSGDPDSLDGVYLPDLRIGVADATSPHVLEPRAIAVTDGYLDLGECYRRGAAMAHGGEIRRLFSAYREKYRRAYDELSRFSPPEPPQTFPPEAMRRLTLAVSCKGVLRLPFPSEPVSLPRPDFREALSRRDAAIVYLHPLWPDLAEAFETAEGKLYFSEIPMPDCDGAIQTLAEAKRLHDELEAAYRPCIDFSVLDRVAERIIGEIFKKRD